MIRVNREREAVVEVRGVFETNNVAAANIEFLAQKLAAERLYLKGAELEELRPCAPDASARAAGQ